MRRKTEPAAKAYTSHLFLVVVSVLGSLVYLWGHVETLRQKEDLARLNAEREALMEQQEHLKAEIASLTLSPRIRSIASRELGMVYPSGAPRNLYLGRSEAVVSKVEGEHAD